VALAVLAFFFFVSGGQDFRRARPHPTTTTLLTTIVVGMPLNKIRIPIFTRFLIAVDEPAGVRIALYSRGLESVQSFRGGESASQVAASEVTLGLMLDTTTMWPFRSSASLSPLRFLHHANT